MSPISPATAQEMAAALADCASRKRPITVIGNNSKRLMAGAPATDAILLSTSGLDRLLQYEPADLTISVEAGMRWAELQNKLAEHRQMIALDPPFAPEATVGGVVATNGSGPMRRAYGTARDLVIGMSFAMLDGKLIQSGGMVVKNVAGLDMSKLLIGSFGTLAALTSVNFRVHSIPEKTRTFLFSFPEVAPAIEKRDSILRSVLQPMMIDLLSPVAAARLDRRGYLLALRAGGSSSVLDRYAKELSGAEVLEGPPAAELWLRVREFTPEFLRRNPAGLVIRLSTTLDAIGTVLKLISGPAVSRAGSGVTYVYLSSWPAAAPVCKAAKENGWQLAIEFAPEEARAGKELWFGGDAAAFDMMRRVKQMFDPDTLLNAGRLYGRL